MIPQARTGRGLTFRLFGFPVTVDPFFFVLVLLIGARLEVRELFMLAAVVFVSVLWHELGHAVAARRLGAQPTITLHGLGGLTMWHPPRNPTRWQMISVAAAGPAAGLILGLAVWVLSSSIDVRGDDVEFLVRAMLWVNVAWGMLNLVPMLPLDGGAVMAELLPGSREVRHRRAALVSVVVGGIGAILLVRLGWWPTAALVGWLVAGNLTAFRSSGERNTLDADLRTASDAIERLAEGDPDALDVTRTSILRLPPSHQAAAKTAAVEAAVFAGSPDDAADLLHRIPANADPALYALVNATATRGRQGIDELAELFDRGPSPYRSRWLTLGLVHAGRLPEIVHHLAAQPRGPETPRLVDAARDVAEWAGDDQVVAQLSGLKS